jgi:CheY-like chemotaxis protein
MKLPTVLIVDDDEDDRHFLEYGFQQSQIKTTGLFKDGYELLKYLNSDVEALPTLIVSDYNMPKISGFELLRTIKKHVRFRHIPFFICSTYGHEKQVQSCLEEGAAGYFIKPSSSEMFVKIVKEDILPELKQKS